MPITLTDSQIQELRRLKQYFPYRIVWARIKDGTFEPYASLNRRALNRSTKEGWIVFVLE